MNKQTVHLARSQQSVTIVEPQLVFTKTKKNVADGAYYYVFSTGKNRGFTIVSGDDRLPAIIGYTDSGTYDTGNLPVNFVSFMQAYQDYVDNATDAELEQVRSWEAMATIHEDVVPFMQSKWNQNAPYNGMCPKYNSTTTAVTGCVSTAIAQILYYYKSPVSLLADIPAYTTKAYGISMPAISAGETYDWGNMLDIYIGKETQVQTDAVAKLMLHTGCAVKMEYGPSSSANATKEVFVKYFGMDKELTRYMERKGYDFAEWDDMLYREMVEQRPVFYSGKSTGGGHSFVVHGYSDGLYSVNWGWGGVCDGYFDITILNPHNTTGAGASSFQDGYSLTNSMIIGIQPDNGVVDETNIPLLSSYSNVTLSGSVTVSGNTLAGTVSVSPYNLNMMEGSVHYSLGCKSDNGSYTTISSIRECVAKDLPINYYYNNVSMPFSFQFEEDKTYRLCLIESRDGVNWMPCENAENTALILQVQMRNGAVTVVTELDVRYNINAVAELGEGGYAGMSNQIKVMVTNTGDKEYYDRVYVRVSNTGIKPGGNTYSTGITAPVGGSGAFDFEYTPAVAGDYTFWILDAKLNEIGQSIVKFQTVSAPKLSFVSVTCSNASDDRIIVQYPPKDYSIDMNKVYGTEASFAVKIKNDGGYYRGPFNIYDKPNKSTGSWFGHIETLTIPADTIMTFTFVSEGNIGDWAGIWIKGVNVSIVDLPSDKQNRHNAYENGVLASYISFGNRELVYLEDPSVPVESIKAVDTSLSIVSAKGAIVLEASGDTDVRIVNMSGTEVAHVMLNAGERTIVSIPSGFYVVNRTKVIVR